MPAPQGSASSHLKGVWGESVATYLKSSGNQLQAQAIGKPDWLSVLEPLELDGLSPVTRKDHQAQCYVLCDQQTEIERYFQRQQPNKSSLQEN